MIMNSYGTCHRFPSLSELSLKSRDHKFFPIQIILINSLTGINGTGQTLRHEL